jgi:polar amino acid transport system substrate-binding protein
LKHAELHRAKGLAGAFDLFVTQKLEALAGLLPALKENSESLPGSRVIDGRYTTVRQAVGTKPQNVALKAFVAQFIAEAKASGLVAELIARHGVEGKLQVASSS